ncbi:MAG: hypothetical protein JXR85_07430 [Deltaproteobacteria bacterium]|nr:hypothetical protein [Deltaproteobacteria bacterium]
MDAIEIKKFLPHSEGSRYQSPREELFAPPWIFKHRDMSEKLETARKVDKKRLINILNLIHFTGRHLFVHFNHRQYDEGILVKAYPEPCALNGLTCRWTDEPVAPFTTGTYIFQQLIISDGGSFLLVPGEVKYLDSALVKIHLPETSYDICQRTSKRYYCHDVYADIVQNGVILQGTVEDFSPSAFRVLVFQKSSRAWAWLNHDMPVDVHIKKDSRILFSGSCRSVRHVRDSRGIHIVLSPLNNQISRFRKAKIRSPRHQPDPSPIITFRHPFFNTSIERELHDVSNSGFAAIETQNDGVLMPGMIIPEITIKYGGVLDIKCAAQVIYRLPHDDNEVRCGLAILDMDAMSFANLTQMLNRESDRHNRISSTVDMNALWEFFFESGFIYPEKYSFINAFREDFKKTYLKLYHEKNPDISQHFTYEKDGKIYGHIAMVRAYERSWMIHHFAATPMESRLTGFSVLKQILLYLNGVHRFPSAGMDYVMTYFRKGNKIIDRIFGGFARDLDDPRGCSLDLFPYLIFSNNSSGGDLPDRWEIRECTAYDIWKFECFYRYRSEGLLISALGLRGDGPDNGTLTRLYKDRGFTRTMKAYSLVVDNEPVACLIVNTSNLGLNLSELLNGIKIIVSEPDKVPWDILSIAIHRVLDDSHMDKIPVMIYPQDYAELHNVPVEKNYYLWILDIGNKGNKFLEYLEKNFRIRLK